MIILYVLAPLTQRPRPFGVGFRAAWTGWAHPSEQVAALVVVLMGILYGLVPQGRWRGTGKWMASGLVASVASAHLYLGVQAPTDSCWWRSRSGWRCRCSGTGGSPRTSCTRSATGAAAAPISTSVGPAGQRSAAPWKTGSGSTVEQVTPFGLAGSAGSTPLRITVKGDPPTYLFGKLYARSHLRADRWYKLGRELLYGRLEL